MTAAQGRAVEHVIVDQRRAVHELDRHRGGQQTVGLRWGGACGQEHEQRAQALAPGGDRLTGIAGEQRAVTRHELVHPPLGSLEQAGRLLTPKVDHRLNCGSAHRSDTTPTCRAMMPPAVTRYLTSRIPKRHMTPASSAGPGNLRTELGR